MLTKTINLFYTRQNLTTLKLTYAAELVNNGPDLRTRQLQGNSICWQVAHQTRWSNQNLIFMMVKSSPILNIIMGLENRDYARNPHPNSPSYHGDTQGWTPVCKFIISANIIVFLAQTFFIRAITLEEYIARFPAAQQEQILIAIEKEKGKKLSEVSPSEKKVLLRSMTKKILLVSSAQLLLEIDTRKIMAGQFWRLFTGAFCHDRSNIMHILFNMLFIYWFGCVLERIYGSREFFLFYFSAILISSCMYVGLDWWLKEYQPAIGASGAVMAIMATYAVHFPRHQILLFFFIPLEIRWLIVLYLAVDLYPVILALRGQGLNTGIAHAGHLGGLAFGFIYTRYQLHLARFFRSQSARSKTPGNPRHNSGSDENRWENADEPFESSLDEFDLQIDQLLRKIKNQGEENLSASEKEALKRASQWYRDRNQR
ncbi:MAG: rhomboid family intramembrane serine protease [Pirellulaceae bacterium]|nr:rhomboid family intramembrane serine protease [Pirellulaceae bacterium]